MANKLGEVKIPHNSAQFLQVEVSKSTPFYKLNMRHPRLFRLHHILARPWEFFFYIRDSLSMALKTRGWKNSFAHTTFEKCTEGKVFDVHNDDWSLTSWAIYRKVFPFALALHGVTPPVVESVIEFEFYGGNYITMKLTPSQRQKYMTHTVDSLSDPWRTSLAAPQEPVKIINSGAL